MPESSQSMADRSTDLVKRAISIYQERGLGGLAESTINFFDYKFGLEKRLLFHPLVPPISLIYKIYSFDFGYRDTYIYNSKSINIPKVAPEPSDTVVEAGVNIGRDTAMYAKLANQVVGFEPSPRNYLKAKKNLRRFKNVKLINEGLWNKSGELDIKYGEQGSEDGFLEPDDGTVEEGGSVRVSTLEKYMDRSNIESIDFLKVEAEGAEPEIIEGMGDLSPEKIVVNADEERSGDPVGKDVTGLLQSQGYDLAGIKNGHILFFVLDSDGNHAFKSNFE